MKTYYIYRAIFADSIEDIDFDNLGQSFAQDGSLAENYAIGKDRVTDGSYFIIEAKVNDSNIDIAQTNGQWESEYKDEGEVVLESHQEIEVTVYQDNEELITRTANTGVHRDVSDETRANPVECDTEEITDYLNEYPTI